MQPTVLILESRPEVADALAGVVALANYRTIVRPHLDRLSDLAVTPAAIIVRIAFEGVSEPAHVSIARLVPGRPPVVAIASAEAEVAEAARLHCDVVLRTPREVHRLCDALTQVMQV